jgi:hypothetical protein
MRRHSSCKQVPVICLSESFPVLPRQGDWFHPGPPLYPARGPTGSEIELRRARVRKDDTPAKSAIPPARCGDRAEQSLPWLRGSCAARRKAAPGDHDLHTRDTTSSPPATRPPGTAARKPHGVLLWCADPQSQSGAYRWPVSRDAPTSQPAQVRERLRDLPTRRGSGSYSCSSRNQGGSSEADMGQPLYSPRLWFVRRASNQL